MAELRIAVIGYGNMGRAHSEWIHQGKIPGALLGAIVDTNEQALSVAADKYPTVPLFSSADALFESRTVDAVLISTPHYFHPPLAIAALNAGYHALVEKPAGVYTKQVKEMNSVADKSNKVFAIMFNQRTRGSHRKMYELIKSGELGEIKRIVYIITSWTRTQTYYNSGGWRATWAGEGGGVLLNQSPHNLDLVQWIAGMPKRVRAFCGFGKHHTIEVEDDVTAYMEYENGATGVFITSTGEAPGTESLEISGDRGKLVLANGNLTFYRTTIPVSQFLAESQEMFSQPEIWKCDIPTGEGEEHIGIIKNFVDAIVNGTPLISSGQEGLHGTTLANAMLLSSWTDAWVDLPFDDDFYYSLLQERIARSTILKEQVESKFVNVLGSF